MKGILGTQQQSAQRSIEQLLSGQIGNDIVPAIQQSANLAFNRGAATLQQQGARFSGAAGQQIADLSQRMGADTNLAVQQALQQNANRRVNELIGAGQLSAQQGQLALSAVQPMQLAALGLGTGAPILEESRGFWGTVGDVAGAVGGIASAIPGVGGVIGKGVQAAGKFIGDQFGGAGGPVSGGYGNNNSPFYNPWVG